MKCPHCGKEIANDSVYCEFCGEKVMQAPVEKKDKYWNKSLIFIVVIALVHLASICVAYSVHWETFAYGTHNTVNELKMHYFQLVVRALERISIAEKQEHPLLQFYRERFAEYQKHSYYRD